MVEVPLPREIFTRRFNEGQTRRPVLEILTKQSGVVAQVSKFKYEQTVFPDNSEVRVISKACPWCFPNSACQLDEETKSLGIRNCFSNYGPVGATNPGECNAVTLHNLFDKKDALYDPKISAKPEEIDNLQKEFYGRPHYGLGWYYELMRRLAGWMLEKIARNVFASICIHQGEAELLRRAHQTGLPIVYLPLYKSNVDPLVIYFTLRSLGLKSPFFFSPRSHRNISQFFGGVGFKTSSTKENSLIRNSIMSTCFHNLLQKGSSISIHLESQRSRSGKPSVELYGTELLNILHNSYTTKEIEDAYIVPLNVSYERLPEHYEEIPFSRSPVTFGSVIKLIFNYIGVGKLGSVRVNFGQPFSLREFGLSLEKNNKVITLKASSKKDEPIKESYHKTFLGAELCWSDQQNLATCASLSSIFDIDLEDSEDDFQPYFVDSLAFHAMYSSMTCGTLLPIHLVAFLLIKKFRDGTTVQILANEVRQLKKLMLKHGRDVGCADGDEIGGIIHAVEILGPDNIIVSRGPTLETTTTIDGLQIQPILTIQSLLRLNYFANSVLSTIAMDAVVAVALFAELGNIFTASKGLDVDLRITDENLMRQTRRVYEVFSSEFFLHSPCLTATVAIRKTFDRLNEANLLQFLMDQTIRRNSRYYEVEEYEDENLEGQGEGIAVDTDTNGEYFFVPHEYKIESTEEGFETLSFLRSLLVPYLEIYAEIVKELDRLFGTNNELMVESELIDQVLETLKAKFTEVDYGDFLSMDIVKRLLLTLEDHSFIEYNIDKKTRVKQLRLTKGEDSKKQFNTLARDILRYVTL